MDAELHKFSINGLASLISPGVVILLFMGGITSLFFPGHFHYIKDYELFSIFLIITGSYVVGSFIHYLATRFEQKLYKYQQHDPRLAAIEKSPHWIEDLDKLYFEKMKLHIYDFNSTTLLPKVGEINGKKLDKYNFSQFDHFAAFYLRKHKLYEEVAMLKEKYQFFRNLSLAFLICSIAMLLLMLLRQWFAAAGPGSFIHNINYIAIGFILLIAASFTLLAASKRQRVSYLKALYRTTRYNYLVEINH